MAPLWMPLRVQHNAPDNFAVTQHNVIMVAPVGAVVAAGWFENQIYQEEFITSWQKKLSVDGPSVTPSSGTPAREFVERVTGESPVVAV